MPAIIPLVALMILFITILLHLIQFILQNEEVVIAAVMLSAIAIIDIQSLVILVYDEIVDLDATG